MILLRQEGVIRMQWRVSFLQFSFNCPLCIAGLVYLTLKHLVDRYNIYFAYGPSKIDKDIHASAINFVIVAVILLQFNVVFFTILRSGRLAVILLSILLFVLISANYHYPGIATTGH
jgi:hypothetical protein